MNKRMVNSKSQKMNVHKFPLNIFFHLKFHFCGVYSFIHANFVIIDHQKYTFKNKLWQIFVFNFKNRNQNAESIDEML